MCYSYSNLQSVIIACTYALWVYNKLIHHSKPRLQITNTRDNINSTSLSHICEKAINLHEAEKEESEEGAAAKMK
jgi:hypothetical protein